MYIIQMASASDKDRYDNKPSNRWEDVIVGQTAEATLLSLIEALNSETIVVNNMWLRLVKPDSSIINM